MTQPTNPTTSSQKKHNAIPYDTSLEKGILGALLLEQEALTHTIQILQPQHFYHPAHKAIYTAITNLFNLAEPIDLLTIINKLRKEGQLNQIGGPAYLAELTENIISAAHIENHARLIIEYAIRRELINTAAEIKTNAHDETKEILSVLDQSQQKLFAIAESNIRKSYTNINTLMKTVVKDLEAHKTQTNEITGLPSGFPLLDKITLGWQNSDFIVIAARPGMGKTSFALSIIANLAIKHNTPTALFSLEMSEEQITKRLIAMESGLENQKIKKKQLKPYEWKQLYHKTANLSRAPIWIDTMHSADLLEFRAKARKLKAQHNIQAIVIDYLQLMDGGKENIRSNREQQIATISRGIKSIAKELNIPIIALSQLSRAVEIRGGDKRPQLSDLRESGAIEQDVDLAIFLYRPSYYGITEDQAGNSLQGVTEVIIAKHRNGPLGTIPLTYLPAITKFIPHQQQNNTPTSAHTSF